MGSLRIALALLAAVLVSAPAQAEKRIALVIGNSAYKKSATLPNPASDASAMGSMLKSAGFDIVETKLNTSASELRKSLRDFTAKSREADIAVIYYAGHGIELDGNNYLIPVDAALETDSDLLDEGVSLERVLFSVEPAKQLRLIILDACRDNPFAKTMRRTIASRAVGRGLAKVEPTSPNTMIAYAAKAGSTASDGDSDNSPYTAALIEHLPKPGLDLRRAFGFVRDDVLRKTGNKQEPYVYGSLGGADVPLVPIRPASSTGPQADPNASVRRDYELALQLGTRDAWEAFLSQYPEGFYANLARGQLNKIAAEEVRIAAVDKARIAEQEKTRLVAEGARQVEQAKAAATAKAAEEARLTAEKAKQLEQEKAAAAERSRIAEQEKARLEAEKAKAEHAKAEQAKAEQARLDAEKASEEKKQQIASVTPPEKPEQVAVDLPRALQAELRRVGCAAAVDGTWNAASQKALALFNKHSGMKLDTRIASLDALDALKGKAGRVCPLVCEQGYRADGERCVKIICRTGFVLNEDNECERRPGKEPSAKPSGKPIESKPTAPQAPKATGGACSFSYDACLTSCARAQGGVASNSCSNYCTGRQTQVTRMGKC